jgi:hypothetical protein
MTATTMQGDRPPSKVRHGWRCAKRGPLVEAIRRDSTGRAHVVEECAECGGSDLLDRLRAERDATP